AAEEHGAEAAARAVRIAVNPLLPELPVRADRGRVSIVLDNLVSNAIRHTRPGGTIELCALPDAAGIRFEVQDQGPGIPAEAIPTVFDRFVRVPGSSPGGAGLGLSIARD